MARANDSIDRRLLALLQANARENTTTLAAKLGVARTTVQERIARLERNGTIKGYSAILGHDPFHGYTQAVLMIAVVQRNLKAVITGLSLFPEVKLCQSVSSDYDIACRVSVPHLEDLAALLEEISELPGVDRIRSWIALSTHFDRMDADIAAYSARASINSGEAG